MLQFFDTIAEEVAELSARAEKALRLDALRATISDDIADAASNIARTYPWLAPGVVSVLALERAPRSVVAQAAIYGAQEVIDRGDYRRPGTTVQPTEADRVRQAARGPVGALFGAQAQGTASAQPRVDLGESVANASMAGFGGKDAARIGFAALESPLQELSGAVQEALVPGNDPAAPSTLGQLYQNWRRGESTDMGDGIFPAGQVEADRMQAAQQFALNVPEIAGAYGHLADEGELYVSPGRLLAMKFAKPGTREFQVASGVVDFAFNFADPSAVLLGGAAKARKASKLFGVPQGARAAFPRAAGVLENTGVIRPWASRLDDESRRALESVGIIDGPRKVVVAQEVDQWLKRSPQGRGAVKWIAETDDFATLYRELGKRGAPAELIQRLTAASDETTVQRELFDAFTGQMDETVDGRILREKFGAPSGFRATVKDSTRRLRFLQMVPHSTIDPEDLDDGLEQIDRVMLNAKLDEPIISRRINEYAAADSVERRVEIIDEVHKDIARKIIGEGGNTARARALAKKVTTRDKRLAFEQAYRSYDIDTMTGLPKGGVGFNYNSNNDPTATATALTEYLHKTVPLADPREIRRATSAFKWVTADTGALPNKVARWGIDAASDFMTEFWQPLQLARAAWFARVWSEQAGFRLPAAGLHGMNHPIQYIMTVLGGAADDGVLAGAKKAVGGGAYRTRVTGEAFTSAGKKAASRGQELIDQSLNRGAAGWAGGRGARRGPLDHAPVSVPDTPNIEQVWARDNLTMLWNEPVAQRAAGGLTPEDMAGLSPDLDPYSFEALSEWFWSGAGRDFRERIATGGDKAKPLLSDRQFADRWLQERYIDRIQAYTGGDQELIQSIATGQLRGVNVRQLDFRPRKAVGQLEKQAERKRARDANRVYGALAERRAALEAEGRMPKYLNKARDVDDGNWKQQADALIDTAFDWMFSRPDNLFSRGVAGRQYYYKRIDELLPYMDLATRRKALQGAKAAGVPKSEYKAMLRKAKNAEPGPIDNFESVDLIAARYARDETKKLLYDVVERHQFAEILRVTNPFLEAWYEMLSTWGRLAATNPKTIRRGQQMIEGARSSGFFYQDEVTGEEMFAYPGGEMMTNLGLRLLGGPTLPGNTEIGMTGNVQGLNLAGNLMPGFGPVITLSAQKLLSADNPNKDVQALREFLLPFGDDDSLADAFLPAYSKRFITAWKNDPESDSMLNTTQLQMVQTLAASGAYTESEIGAIAAGEQGRLWEDAKKAAQRIFILRGLAQFVLPTGPSPRMKVAKPEELQTPGGQKMFALQELAARYREMTVENGGDWEEATAAFVEEFGWELTVATQSKSRAVAQRPVTEAGVGWINANRDIATTLPFTVGLAAPDPAGEFDIDAFIQQYSDNVRDPLTAEQFTHLRNNFLGWQAYEAASRRVESLPEEQQKQYLSAVKTDLYERYPGFNSTILGLTEKPPVQQMVDEVVKWPEYPQIMSTPAGQAAAEYLAVREQMVARAAQKGIVGWTQANATFQERQYLRYVGEQILARNEDFQPVWRYVFEPELEQGNTDEDYLEEAS